MNTRTFCLIGWLAAASLCNAQSPSAAASPGEPRSWRQLIQQWPKAGAEFEAAGDQAADAGRYAEAVTRYEAWRDMPGSAAEQKALATIKLAQLAEAQFEIDQARTAYLQALSMVPPAGGVAHEIRLRIEDGYRRQGDLPALVKVWQNHLQSHGDDPEAGLLLANALTDLRRPEEGVPWPHHAGPTATTAANTLHLKAALAARRAGQVKEELAALQAAFEAESDPLARLDLVGGLGMASALTGQLPELIAGFRAKAHTEADGWRYAVYLAEIQRGAGNAAGAQEELARAFGPRSRDVLFLTEAWRLSYDQRNTAERARLARLLAQIAPGTAREIELVSALLRNNENAEALQGLRANEDTLSADPLQWHDALLEAGATGLGEITIGLLESCRARQPADWRLRFLLAEARLQTGDFAAAEKLFREMEVAAAATVPPAEAGADAETANLLQFINGFTYNSGTANGVGVTFARRNVRSAETRQLLQRVADGFNGGLSAVHSQQFPFQTYGRYPSEDPLPKSPAEAADAALVMRSVLAQQQGKAAEFIAELQATLAPLPRAERIARLVLVQALDPLLQELTAEATAPSGDKLAQATGLEALLCLSMEMTPAMGRVNIDPSVLIPLLKSFLAHEEHPDTLVLGNIELSRLLQSAGQEKEAANLAHEALDQWAAVPERHRYRVFEFALQKGDVDRAEAMIAALAEEARQSGSPAAETALVNYQIRLASVVAQEKAGDPRLLKVLSEAMRNSFALGSVDLLNRATQRARSAIHQAQKFPYGSRLVEIRSWTWSMIFDAAAQQEQVPALRAAIAQKALDLPPERSLRARLAGICFAWWAKDRNAAIREVLDLAAAQQDDELYLLAGSMLAEAGRNDEAQPWFERVSSTDGEINIDKVARLLALARVKKDTAGARKLALQLAELPLSVSDQIVLQGILNELDLKEQALNFSARHQARNETAFYTGVAGAVQRMQRESKAGHEREAIDLARGILARLSPLDKAQMARYHRTAALDTLRQLKALPDYTDELNRQLAADPKSTETLLRLAEALGRKDAAQSIALYRRAVETRPADLSLQPRLARALADDRQSAEALQTWNAILAKEPQLLFGDDFQSILASYQTAKQLDQLSAILRKMPAPSNPLEALVLFGRDTSNSYQQVASALQREHQLSEAIQVWQASLTRARAIKAPSYVESTILQALLPALLEAKRKEDAAQEIENYFFPPAVPRPLLGYEVKSTKRNWTELSYGMDGRVDLQGAAVMNSAVPAGALDRLRAKAAAAATAHPQDPERLLTLWVDVLRRDPAQLEALQKEFDEVLASLQPRGQAAPPDRIEIASSAGLLTIQTPWTAATATVLRTLAELLAEQPESRSLALHVLEQTPDIGGQKGWLTLRRAKVALTIPDKEAATRALRKWMAWNDDSPSIFGTVDAAQLLTAAELLSSADMTAEAVAVFQRLQASGDLDRRNDLKKRAEELSLRLAPSAEGKLK